MHPVARSAIPAILPNPASNVRADAVAQPQVSPGTIPTGVPGADKAASAASNTDRLPPVFPASLTAGDLDTLQSVDHATHGNSANSPAQQARAFIADNPDFANMPFGRVVSQFARGETPVVDTTGDGTTPSDTSTGTGSNRPPVDGSTPPTDTSSGTPSSDTPTDTASNPPTDTSSDVPPGSTTDTPTDTASDVPPTDTSLPSGSTPDIAVTDPDQALIDALT